MSRPKLSKEEKAARRKIQQKKYYLKKRQKLGITSRYPRQKPDLMVSAELIQKNWVRIQRSAFNEDIQNYFVQLFQRQMKEIASENTKYPVVECPDTQINQEITSKSVPEINENSKSSINLEEKASL